MWPYRNFVENWRLTNRCPVVNSIHSSHSPLTDRHIWSNFLYSTNFSFAYRLYKLVFYFKYIKQLYVRHYYMSHFFDLMTLESTILDRRRTHFEHCKVCTVKIIRHGTGVCLRLSLIHISWVFSMANDNNRKFKQNQTVIVNY